MQRFCLFILLLSVLALVSCQETTTTVTPSSNAKLASFSLRANDSIPAYASAVFTIEELGDSGRVYNSDSLAYRTPLDSVVPYFRFNSTPALARVFINGDSIDLTGTDTLDFNVQPVRMYVVAADLVTKHWYNIYINVHQIDPYLFTWRQLSEAIALKNIEQQKALWFKGGLFWFVKDAVGVQVWTSDHGAKWQLLSADLPADIDVRSMAVFAGRLVCAAADGALWFSLDAVHWEKKDLSAESITAENLLFEFVDSLWMVVKSTSDDSYHLATTCDMQQFSIHPDPLPASFPVADCASAVFLSRSYRPRAIVFGGYSQQGVMLASRWSAEQVNGVVRWTDYSLSRGNFSAVAGTQIVPYNGMLLMLGGLNADNSLRSTGIWQSVDEGLSWTAADTASNALPASFTPRYRHSFFVDDDDNLFVIGGQSLTETFSDVYTGKLGSLDFED